MRTFSSSFTNAITNGGSIYWMVIVEPNTIDTFLPMVFGNIIQSSLSGYSVMSGRLIDITDIDQSIDILGEYIAKTPDVQFKIQNIDGAIILDNFIGRTCTIRLGLGQTMSIASSEIFFTGKISDFKNTGFELDVTAKGMLSAFDTDIGFYPSNLVDADKNKMAPIVHGNFTDEYASVPVLRFFVGKSGLSILKGEKKLYNENEMKFVIYDKSNFSLINIRQNDKNGNPLFTNSSNTFDKLKTTGAYTIGSVFDINGGVHLIGVTDSSWVPSKDESNKINPIIIKIDDWFYNVIGKDTINAREYIYLQRYGDGATSIMNNRPIDIVSEDQNDCFLQFLKDIECDSVSNFIGISGNEISSEFIKDNTSLVLRNWANIGNKISNGTTRYDAPISKSYDLSSIGFDMFVPLNCSFDGKVLKCKILIDATITPNKFTTQTGNDYGFYAKFGLAFDNIPDKNMHYTDGIGIKTELINDKTGEIIVNNFNDLDELDSSWKTFEDKSIIDFNETKITFYVSAKSRYTYASDQLVFAIRKRGVRVLVSVNIKEVLLYYNGYGREHPGGYYNGVSGDLIENPSIIIEDFCRTSAKMINYNLDKNSFDSIYTLREQWKLSTCIYSEM